MYTIYADGELVHNTLLAEEGIIVLSPKLTLEVNHSGSLTFVMAPTHPLYNSIKKLKTIVTVYMSDILLFEGRILQDERDFRNRKTVYCEGNLSYLCDSVQKPYSFEGSIRAYLERMISQHNDQVEEAKRFILGDITVTLDSESTFVSEEYVNTLDSVSSGLVDNFGGYIRTRRANGHIYLDYLKDFNRTSSQIIEFGANLLDLTEYISAENVFTVLIPLGADGLTVAKENDGKDYIVNEEAVELFGKIWRVETWEDIIVPRTLLRIGTEYLKEAVKMALTLEIKAIDLSMMSVDYESILLGDMVRVLSVPHGLDDEFLCSKIEYDLNNPSNTVYTFGASRRTLTDRHVKSLKDQQANMNSVNISINKTNSAIGSIAEIAYKEKASVETKNDLPTEGNEIGDVRKVVAETRRYVWTESGWDKL